MKQGIPGAKGAVCCLHRAPRGNGEVLVFHTTIKAGNPLSKQRAMRFKRGV